LRLDLHNKCDFCFFHAFPSPILRLRLLVPRSRAQDERTSGASH
jgi:hypothetical protein